MGSALDFIERDLLSAQHQIVGRALSLIEHVEIVERQIETVA